MHTSVYVLFVCRCVGVELDLRKQRGHNALAHRNWIYIADFGVLDPRNRASLVPRKIQLAFWSSAFCTRTRKSSQMKKTGFPKAVLETLRRGKETAGQQKGPLWL